MLVIAWSGEVWSMSGIRICLAQASQF